MRTFFFVSLAVTGIACGSRSFTNLPQDKVASSLSPADRTQLCRDIYDFRNANVSNDAAKRIVCGDQSRGNTDPASCRMVFDACMANPAPPRTTSGSCTAETFAWNFACPATVGDIQRCEEAMEKAWVDQAAKEPTCAPQPKMDLPACAKLLHC